MAYNAPAAPIRPPQPQRYEQAPSFGGKLPNDSSFQAYQRDLHPIPSFGDNCAMVPAQRPSSTGGGWFSSGSTSTMYVTRDKGWSDRSDIGSIQCQTLTLMERVQVTPFYEPEPSPQAQQEASPGKSSAAPSKPRQFPSTNAYDADLIAEAGSAAFDEELFSKVLGPGVVACAHIRRSARDPLPPYESAEVEKERIKASQQPGGTLPPRTVLSLPKDAVVTTVVHSNVLLLAAIAPQHVLELNAGVDLDRWMRVQAELTEWERAQSEEKVTLGNAGDNEKSPSSTLPPLPPKYSVSCECPSVTLVMQKLVLSARCTASATFTTHPDYFIGCGVAPADRVLRTTTTTHRGADDQPDIYSDAEGDRRAPSFRAANPSADGGPFNPSELWSILGFLGGDIVVWSHPQQRMLKRHNSSKIKSPQIPGGVAVSSIARITSSMSAACLAQQGLGDSTTVSPNVVGSASGSAVRAPRSPTPSQQSGLSGSRGNTQTIRFAELAIGFDNGCIAICHLNATGGYLQAPTWLGFTAIRVIAPCPLVPSILAIGSSDGALRFVEYPYFTQVLNPPAISSNASPSVGNGTSSSGTPRQAVQPSELDTIAAHPPILPISHVGSEKDPRVSAAVDTALQFGGVTDLQWVPGAAVVLITGEDDSVASVALDITETFTSHNRPTDECDESSSSAPIRREKTEPPLPGEVVGSASSPSARFPQEECTRASPAQPSAPKSLSEINEFHEHRRNAVECYDTQSRQYDVRVRGFQRRQAHSSWVMGCTALAVQTEDPAVSPYGSPTVIGQNSFTFAESMHRAPSFLPQQEPHLSADRSTPHQDNDDHLPDAQSREHSEKDPNEEQTSSRAEPDQQQGSNYSTTAAQRTSSTSILVFTAACDSSTQVFVASNATLFGTGTGGAHIVTGRHGGMESQVSFSPSPLPHGRGLARRSNSVVRSSGGFAAFGAAALPAMSLLPRNPTAKFAFSSRKDSILRLRAVSPPSSSISASDDRFTEQLSCVVGVTAKGFLQVWLVGEKRVIDRLRDAQFKLFEQAVLCRSMQKAYDQQLAIIKQKEEMTAKRRQMDDQIAQEKANQQKLAADRKNAAAAEEK